MANLLPKQTKVNLLWSKRVRVALVFFVMVFVGLSIAAAALLPVALYSKVVLDGLAETKALPREVAQGTALLSFGKQRQEIIRELRRDKELLESIRTMSALPQASKLLIDTETLATSVNGIAVRLISLDAHIAQDLYAIRISGTATSRAAVVALREAFEASEDLLVTDFPLGNLTPQSDEYLFVIEVATYPQEEVSNKNDE